MGIKTYDEIAAEQQKAKGPNLLVQAIQAVWREWKEGLALCALVLGLAAVALAVVGSIAFGSLYYKAYEAKIERANGRFIVYRRDGVRYTVYDVTNQTTEIFSNGTTLGELEKKSTP